MKIVNKLIGATKNKKKRDGGLKPEFFFPIIDKHFGNFILPFSLYLIISLRSYIKHSKKCFIRNPNISKLV